MLFQKKHSDSINMDACANTRPEASRKRASPASHLRQGKSSKARLSAYPLLPRHNLVGHSTIRKTCTMEKQSSNPGDVKLKKTTDTISGDIMSEERADNDTAIHQQCDSETRDATKPLTFESPTIGTKSGCIKSSGGKRHQQARRRRVVRTPSNQMQKKQETRMQ